MGYYWATTPELPEGRQQEVGLLAEFDEQSEAESWLTSSYPDLIEAGADQVSLYENQRLIYGPMGLRD
jgi:hypothetical protein